MKTSRSAQDVQVRKLENIDVQDEELADRRSKNKGTSMEELERCFHQRELNALLIRDPVLKILKPKLIGSLQGPVTAPIETTNQLEAIRRIMKLLQEAGFIAGEFDAQKLLECDHDQVINAGKSLFEKLIPLTGRSGSIDQAIISIKEGCQTGS